MKTLQLMVVASMLALGVLRGEEEGDPPVMIRVYVEYVELSQENLLEIMEGEEGGKSGSIHGAVRALVKKKEAHIMESCIVVARPGQRASIESLMDYIYPSEYEPPGFGSELVTLPLLTPGALLRPETPTSFETRSVGVTLEIEPNIGASEDMIDLRFAPEIVRVLRLETWQEHVDEWGSADMKRPIFSSMRTSTGMALKGGKFAFVSAFSPTRKSGGLDPDRRIMMFVRADIVGLEPAAKAE